MTDWKAVCDEAEAALERVTRVIVDLEQERDEATAEADRQNAGMREVALMRAANAAACLGHYTRPLLDRIETLVSLLRDVGAERGPAAGVVGEDGRGGWVRSTRDRLPASLVVEWRKAQAMLEEMGLMFSLNGPDAEKALSTIESQARLIEVLVRDCGIRESELTYANGTTFMCSWEGHTWRPGDEGYDELLAAVRRVRE